MNIISVYGNQTIDKTEIDQCIEHENISANMSDDIARGLIVSLTSFPPRIIDLKYTLYSLVKQSILPEKIVVWLAEEEFPLKKSELPSEILKFENYGVEFHWCKNIFSYKKLIPSLKNFPQYHIITADDDIFYPRGWLRILWNEHEKYPSDVIAHRAHEIWLNKDGYIDKYSYWRKSVNVPNAHYRYFATGAGGILYPAGSLYHHITKSDMFLALAPKSDDIWFWAMTILANTKIRIAENCICDLILHNPQNEVLGIHTLNSINVKQNFNDEQIARVIKVYPKCLEIVKNEYKSYTNIIHNESEDCIIYGAGGYGRRAYWEYITRFNILFYVDRDYQHKTSINNLAVYNPNVLCNYQNVRIIIAVKEYDSILEHLHDIGMTKIDIMPQ